MSAGEKIVILNVDDLESQRYVKTRDLHAAGFAVIEAQTGAEALRLIEQHRPPLVLLDVQLPDISGFEVCAFIKTKWPEVMVLQTSATFTASEDRVSGLNAGADSYLVQPAEPVELAAAINALLRVRRSEDALRALNATLDKQVQARTEELEQANRKLREEVVQRQKAESQLLQSQKMEAVGQLTGGLAHDFNNLLTAVVGNLDLIRARATEPRIARLAENAFKAAERGSKLTAQLLAFSRTQKLATESVDLNRLIMDGYELLKQSLGANIAMQTDLHPSAPCVVADYNQLEVSLLNLAINARDAMPEGGTLTITTACDDTDDRKVVLSVTDTGTGMSPEVIARAFDPFFTTKPPGKGTGLGLSQVYGLVRQMGGDVAIKSEIGKGTSIQLLLRRSNVSTETATEAQGAAERGHAERILIVDDDHDVRGLMTDFLSDIGYVVHEADHGAAALALQKTVNPQLMIIDFSMPGTNGAEVVKAARAVQPSLPVLFVSGYADSAALEAAMGTAPFLRKPFRPAELASAVRTTLDAGGGSKP
ncbi:response regulator [Bradyrhizobium sp. LTSP857]|uniref:response regulator n=1 Tax=Bradyrhizobium sp. LTSP857 TaxID=1619231 RepID=UPI0005D28B14|nr:response regulator [Bradyrhizobium sp. LTSP857]KJC35093.1 histidine kinase [Bradyrhizobium sp. LTSP857]